VLVYDSWRSLNPGYDTPNDYPESRIRKFRSAQQST